MKILHSTNAEEGNNGKTTIIFPLKKARPRSQLLVGWVPQGHSAVAPGDAWPGGLQWGLAECTSFWDGLRAIYRSSTSVKNNAKQ